MEIRNYSEGDKVKILELFEIAFRKKLNPEFWSWRFEQNILAQKMIKLMWDGDILAGHYALSPVELDFDGQVILSALSMTTMTHPGYTGKGIFTTLASELFAEQSRESGLQVVWGFPNANSHPGFVSKLQWRDITVMPVFSANAVNFGAAAAFREPVKQFTDKHVSAYYATSGGYRIKVRKTEQYLNWRYFACPNIQYVVFDLEDNGVNYYVVSKLYKTETSSEIDIVELVAPNDSKIIATLLSCSMGFWGKTASVSRFNMWIPLSDIKHLALERLGFTYQLPITYMAGRSFGGIKNSDIIANPFNWMISMGDSDVF